MIAAADAYGGVRAAREWPAHRQDACLAACPVVEITVINGRARGWCSWSPRRIAGYRLHRLEAHGFGFEDADGRLGIHGHGQVRLFPMAAM
ncbi:hypothetical protein CP973_19520 [Streptomyces albofaciens JCM 4342]|uniref:hypothetical protein n=1 Tax=Streptomyces albofaciens TaxID=66866 RepID=UPI0012391341|nr:hypothetical protein [Streptomyces albofaciens]KAA6223819.1 hypothetical protein CP973_19520 [Streptomyces albofaciens JCM 4342]